MRRAAAFAVSGLATVLLAGFESDQAPSVPDRIVIGTLATRYPPVELDHAGHVELADDCASCHHRPFGEPVGCASCHDDPVAPTAFIHDRHWQVEDCSGCHRRPSTADLRCGSCHTVEPDPERLELIGLKGAYHGLCLGCHGEAEAPRSCALCHPHR